MATETTTETTCYFCNEYTNGEKHEALVRGRWEPVCAACRAIVAMMAARRSPPVQTEAKP